jgi:hypothetical protein
MMNCPGCGAVIQEDAAFCEYCGVAVKKRLEAGTPGSVPTRPVEGTWSASREDHRSAAPKASLKKVSPIIMIFFSLLTFFIYPVAWLFLRQGVFNSMSEKTRLNPVLPGLFACAGLALAGVLNADSLIGPTVPQQAIDTAISYIVLAYFILSTVLTFTLRRILREYAARMDKSPLAANIVARSEVFAFLFQFLYIQQSINLLIEAGLVERAN